MIISFCTFIKIGSNFPIHMYCFKFQCSLKQIFIIFAVQPHVNQHDCSNKPRIKQWDMQKVGGAINVAEEGGAQLLP